MPNVSHIIRVAWLLFSDLATRFNILSDECAHLQDTIFGLLQTTSNSDLGIDKPGEDGQERPWVARKPRVDSYHRLSNHERALINLWNSVGSLAEGLDAHQRETSSRFHSTIQGLLEDKPEPESFYWFAAQRGHFLHDVFGFYTKQLEHAHQKLLQLLENMPGSLPNPLLLRRWHSAFYGEFLSEYSRHVNWQTQTLTWEMLRGALSRPKQHSDFSKWRDSIFLTHTWAHIPTSLARRHRLDSDSEEPPLHFDTVWSSFFYLEQPLLFPLLYHECAHFCLDDPLIDLDRETSGPHRFEAKGRYGGSKFFYSRDEAAATLRSLVRPESEDERFWNQFTDEVWADAVSLTLGGIGYCAALVLQLFAQCGASAYHRFEAERDQLTNIRSFGTAEWQVREVPWGLLQTGDHSYFWEARLRVAIELTRELHGDANVPWLDAISTTLDYYLESYRSVYKAASTSQLHETWAYLRVTSNQWAAEVCWRCLKPHVPELKKHRHIDNVYSLDRPICDLIEKSIFAYQEKVLAVFPVTKSPKATHIKLPETTRLEDVCCLTQWHLSGYVAAFIQEPTNQTDVRRLVGALANYVGNDGGSAFRIALEWCAARKDLFEAAADSLSTNLKSRATSSANHSESLKAAIEIDLRGGNLEGNQAQEFLLRKQHLTNEKYLPKSRRLQLDTTKSTVSGLLCDAVGFFGDAADGHEIRVGTIFLGVLRPWEVETTVVAGGSRNCSDSGLYCQALGNTQRYFAEMRKLLEERSCSTAKHQFEFLPLVGEYSFLAYFSGVTPVERDCHPINVPKHFTKPRFVLEVFRGGRARLESGDPQVGLFSSYERPFGRVTLLRLRYRWQWMDVRKFAKRLELQIDPILFLSSGWEDAILISWHHNENDYWATHRELRKVLGDHAEYQSNAIVRGLLKCPRRAIFDGGAPEEAIVRADSTRERWMKALSEGRYTQGDRGRVVEKINLRTGRYDYTIVWRRQERPIDARLMDFAEIMEGLPRWFWRHIGRISTSYEQVVCASGSESQTNCEESVLVSRILMRSSSRGRLEDT